jgi:putative salt-induced outer membrane protein YdiY
MNLIGAGRESVNFVCSCYAVVIAACAFALPAYAQDPAAPKIWTVQASAGLTLTSGNTDTSTINAAYDLTYDPETRNRIKSDGLFLRGKTEDVLSAHRLTLNVRDELEVRPRVFVFGQNQYLRDEFKNIDYLVAPGVGVGVKVFDDAATKLDVDGGLGGAWEKNPGAGVRSSGAVTAGQRLTQTLTSTTTLTQSVSALWKTNDWQDALYALSLGVAASMSTRTQLKVELQDTFKNRPPDPTIQKNDVAVLMAIVYKM